MFSSLFFLSFHYTLHACSYSHPAGTFLTAWKRECAHPLCGTVLEGSVKRRLEANGVPSFSDLNCTQTSEGLQKIQMAASPGSVLLLGEIHDNPEHHRFRAQFMRPPVVVLEQFTLDQQTEINEFYKSISTLPSEDRWKVFQSQLRWDKSPWAKYDYEDLWRAILSPGNIFIRAGDPLLSQVRTVSKLGAAALTTQDLERFTLSRPFSDAVAASLKDDIKDAHCGLLPESALDRMAFAQRLRDATLADVTLQAIETYGSSIVLAGNGHVRRDRGIPWYLQQRAPSLKIVSVMLVEVRENMHKPEDYSLRDQDQSPLADYFVFTPQAQREDPCEEFSKKIEKQD